MANFTALKTAINNAIKTNGNEEITGAILQAILDAMVETLGDSAINDLENAITTEVTNRENAVGGVADDLAAEALARANKDNQLDGRINQEEYNRQNADAALSQTMSQGFQTLGSQMTALNAAISALNAAYQNGYLYGGIATPSSSPSNNKCFYIALQGGTYTNFGGVGVVEGINIIKNDSGWKVEHIYDQTTLLNEFYLLRQQVIQAITSFTPIVIEGDVTNAPDEEDLTSNANHLLQFKNNAYSPLEFSGLGRKYLRKNIAPLSESAPFNGFVEGVTAEETLSGTPTQIFWDRMNTRFVGIKDGIYYAAWTDDDNYIPVSTSLVYMYNGTPYQWTGSDFIVDETEVPNLVNCLTQDMINEANTIFIIRYDYTLKEDITIPANCVLQFDGGSISGEHTITGVNTGIQAGLVKIFGADVLFGGTWRNAFSFIQCGCTNNEADATTNTAIINKLLSVETIKDFVVETIIPINGSINLTRGEFRLKGRKVRTQCGFSVISNNTPCFVYHFANTSSPMSSANLFFDTFCIKYKTWQYDYDDSICFKFTADAHYSWGWLQMYFNNLHIENAYGVVTNLVEPIWDTYWTDIYCYNIAGYFWRTSVLGQLQNVFKNVSVLNYGHRTYTEETKDTNVVGRLFYFTGECHFENIDIEDWYGCLFYSPDCITTIINSHFERNYTAGGFSSAIELNGRFVFRNNNVYDHHIAFDVNTSMPRSFFGSANLAKGEIKNNSLNITNDSGAAYGLFNFNANTLQKAKDFVLEADTFGSLSTAYGVNTTNINKLIINGVKRLTTQNFTSSTISNLKIVEKGDTTFYNDIKVYAKYDSSTDGTTYQGQSASYGQVLYVTAAVASKFKVNEQIKIEGINKIYKISYINTSGDNAEIGLDGYIMSGVATYNFSHLTPKDCLFYCQDDKPITADIQKSGTFANKPVNYVNVGDSYFCTDKQTTEGATNGIMIFYKGNNVWVDALGRTVS